MNPTSPFTTEDPRSIILKALDALKKGDKDLARQLAWHATSLVPDSEAPWLILAAVTKDPDESMKFIKVALDVNPNSRQANKAREWVAKQQAALWVKTEVKQSEPAPSAEQLPVETIQPIRENLSKTADLVPPGVSRTPAEPAENLLRTAIKARSTRKSGWRAVSILLITLLGLGILAIAVGYVFFRPQLMQFFAGSSTATTCSPTLALGNQTFTIQPIKPGRDGTLKTPSGHPDRAYWVEGTDTNAVFVLGSAPETLAVAAALKAGDSALVTWANCNSIDYTLSSPFAGRLENIDYADQSVSQLIVFIQTDTAGNGFLVRGELAQETITSFTTPDAADVQAEFTLLGASASSSDGTLMVSVSIYNYGQDAIVLNAEDISLTPEGGAAQPPLSAEPPLPAAISPGATTTFSFNFAWSSATTVIFKIFNTEFYLEGNQ